MSRILRRRRPLDSRGRRGQRGQALLEFAVVFPVFMLLLFGIIDVGRYVYVSNSLNEASREGARYGTVDQWQYACPASVGSPDRFTCTAAVTLGRLAGAPANVASSVTCMTVGAGAAITPVSAANCGQNDLLVVTATAPELRLLHPGHRPDPRHADHLRPDRGGSPMTRSPTWFPFSPREATTMPSMQHRDGERGQILVLFAGGLVALILVVGLVVDGGTAFVNRRDGQNAADLASLAATKTVADTWRQAVNPGRYAGANAYDAIVTSLAANNCTSDCTWTARYVGPRAGDHRSRISGPSGSTTPPSRAGTAGSRRSGSRST